MLLNRSQESIDDEYSKRTINKDPVNINTSSKQATDLLSDPATPASPMKRKRTLLGKPSFSARESQQDRVGGQSIESKQDTAAESPVQRADTLKQPGRLLAGADSKQSLL